VGATAARALARGFRSLDALAAATPEAIQAVPGVGPTIARSVHDWLGDADNAALVDKLRAAGVRLAEAGAEGAPAGPLAGRTVVVTGTLSSLSREQAERAIEAAGGVVGASVSKRTAFLVAGSDPGATKYQRAHKLGVEIVDEAEFLRRLDPGTAGSGGDGN
jgi:DNA ligase (NAD+)